MTDRFAPQGTKTIGTRFPTDAVRAIDAARKVGLFQRSRSEFIRDAVVAHIQSDGAMLAAVRRELNRNASSLARASTHARVDA